MGLAADVEDGIFRDTLAYFNEIRPATSDLLSRVIADLEESERFRRYYDTVILALEHEILECGSALAERSARFLRVDSAVVARLKDLAPRLSELQKKFDLVSNFLDDTSSARYRNKISHLKNEYDLLFQKRQAKLEAEFGDIEEAVRICINLPCA